MFRMPKPFSSSLSQAGTLTPLLIAFSAAAVLACSGADSSDESAELYPEPIPPPSGEEREAEFQRLTEASLSQEELIAAEAVLQDLGVDLSEATFAGRMVALGDSYIEVDHLIGKVPDSQDNVAKGRTLAVVNNSAEIQEGGVNFPMAPVLFSRVFNGNYQFIRPDISPISIVVPNGPTTSFLIGAFQQAVSNIENAANDCLASSMVVRTQAEYDALPLPDKNATKPIFVRYGARSTVCPLGSSSTNGCALYPRRETRDFDFSLSSTRLVPGTRIGINSARVNSSSPNLVGIVTHELLHTLGMAHQGDSANGLVVVGTSGNAFNTSVMHDAGTTLCTSGCLFVNTPSATDIDTIDTLFSPQPGAGCNFVEGFKTIVAN